MHHLKNTDDDVNINGIGMFFMLDAWKDMKREISLELHSVYSQTE
jgi:hypothetical protein